MKILCIQPPFTQLNAPYPAVWYLDAFLKSRGEDSSARDLSIETARALFSGEGLRAAFQTARTALAGKEHPDAATAARIAAYLDQEGRYLAYADSILDFLSGKDPGFSYRLAVGAGLPSGMRTEALLGEQGGIAPQDAGMLATAILNDLADFISYSLDPSFSVVRYAESLARSAPDFEPILKAARDSWVLSRIFSPILRSSLEPLAQADEPLILALSAPFPGCLAGAARAAMEAKDVLGNRAITILGGGYVSTELRETEDAEFFGLFDYVAYDGGYGALASIVDHVRNGHGKPYHTRWFEPRTGGVSGSISAACSETPSAVTAGGRAQVGLAQVGLAQAAETDYAATETKALASIHPDYSGAPLADYLRVVDSPNPMHRLWNDTPWLKYRLAYGCYWRRCAFCDTQLDYIRRYLPSDLDRLMEAAGRAADASGLRGIHFVDEAMPPALVRAFASRNRERRLPFTFWGNARYDKAWTDGLCAAAAEGGLVAVSGGIEIATGRGLQIVDKGFTLTDLLRSLASFKRQGILTHGYLIYGFPGQDDQDIADSAEMVRALLAEGLLDSAFWHKFVLTRHSRMYESWERGEIPTLKPRQEASRFALNDLRFDGENAYDRWTAPLDASLAAWMDRGEFERPLSSFLPKSLPRPRVKPAELFKAAGL